MVLLKKLILRERESFLSSADPEGRPRTVNLTGRSTWLRSPQSTGKFRTISDGEMKGSCRQGEDCTLLFVSVYTIKVS